MTLCPQKHQIITFLKSSSCGLTTFEAFTKLNQTKLTSRLSELRDMGYVFSEKKEKHNGKWWLRFRLASEPVSFVEQEKGQYAFA